MKKYSIVIAYLFVCFSCSETDPAAIGGNDEFIINAGVSTTVREGAVSRADSPEPKPFTKDFDLFLTRKVSGEYKEGPVLRDAKYVSSAFNVFDGTSKMYWDDFGGINAVLDLLGIYPKDKVTDISNSFAWSVSLDQTPQDNTDFFEQSDLLISDQLEYSLSIQKTNSKLIFKHALSKVTFVLIPGEGFDGKFEDTDLTRPKAKVINFNTTCDVTPGTKTAEGYPTLSNNSTPNNITLKYISTDEDNIQTFEAIVVPGQTFEEGVVFGQIEIKINESTNTYNLKMPNKIDKIEQGKNYLFEVTINKSSVDIEALVTGWDEIISTDNEAKINIDKSISSIGNNGITKESELLIHVDGNKGRYKATKEEDSSPIKWKSINKIYWDNINISSAPKANAVLCLGNSIDDIDDNPGNIYIGESQALDRTYNYIQFKEMTHPFSKINLTIKSKKVGDERVELNKITNILFNDLYKFDKVETSFTATDFLSISYKTTSMEFDFSESEPQPTDDGAGYMFYKIDDLYIKPGKPFAKNDMLLEITVQETSVIVNKYPFKIPTAAGVTFEANKEYNITITLKKTEIVDMEVSITGWEETDDIGGIGTINNK